jgi:DNA-binding transcriptional LysR family regulator
MTPLGRMLKSPRSLLIFEAAARLGSCSAAAREFNLTQPSVSRNIAELEEQLAATLFVRGPLGLTLTPDGQKLYRTVNESLQRIGQTMREIGAHAPRKRVVELSLSTAFVTHWFIPRMRAFQQAFPDVDLRFQLISGALKGPVGNVDLAMRRCGRDELDEWTWEFAPEIVLPVCSPSYLEDKGPLEEWMSGSEGHVLLQLSDTEINWHTVTAEGRFAAVPPDNWIEFTDYAVVLQAALGGQGIALGWVSAISRSLVERTLLPASRHQIVSGQIFCLIAQRGRPVRSVVLRIRDWMIAEMRQELAALPVLQCALAGDAHASGALRRSSNHVRYPRTTAQR